MGCCSHFVHFCGGPSIYGMKELGGIMVVDSRHFWISHFFVPWPLGFITSIRAPCKVDKPEPGVVQAWKLSWTPHSPLLKHLRPPNPLTWRLMWSFFLENLLKWSHAWPRRWKQGMTNKLRKTILKMPPSLGRGSSAILSRCTPSCDGCCTSYVSSIMRWRSL